MTLNELTDILDHITACLKDATQSPAILESAVQQYAQRLAQTEQNLRALDPAQLQKQAAHLQRVREQWQAQLDAAQTLGAEKIADARAETQRALDEIQTAAYLERVRQDLDEKVAETQHLRDQITQAKIQGAAWTRQLEALAQEERAARDEIARLEKMQKGWEDRARLRALRNECLDLAQKISEVERKWHAKMG